MNKDIAVFLPFALLAGATARAQDDDVTPGANLVAEGIPRIPASLAAEVDRYGEFRSASLLD